jgi:hypothetical protein
MLVCLKLRLKIRLGASPLHPAFTSHWNDCPGCHAFAEPIVLQHRLFSSLSVSPDVTEPGPDFYAGVRRRIRILQAEHLASAPAQSVGWEGVVLQFQRVILSGAAAAALCIGLLAYSHSPTAVPAVARESGLESYIRPTQGDRIIITRSEPISQDDVLFALVTEDSEYARQ